jgi:hypothetical protein
LVHEFEQRWTMCSTEADERATRRQSQFVGNSRNQKLTDYPGIGWLSGAALGLDSASPKVSHAPQAFDFESFETIAANALTMRMQPKSDSQASNTHGYCSTKSKHYSARNYERLGENPGWQSSDAVY